MKETAPFLKKLYFYDNYRSFLNDFFEYAKKVKTTLSKRNFAKRAGFSSHSFLVHIIKGERNITDRYLSNFTQALGLNEKQQEYFKYLVKYNQAKTTQEKEIFYKKICELRESTHFFKFNNSKHYLYLRQWYYPVVREVCVIKKSFDPKIIASAVLPKISVKEAKHAIEDLLESELLKKDNLGNPILAHPLLSGEDTPAFVYNKIKKDYIFKAIESIEAYKPNQRHICCTTVTLTPKQYEKVAEMIDQMRSEVLSMAQESTCQSQKVMQFNLQLYPLTTDLNCNGDNN